MAKFGSLDTLSIKLGGLKIVSQQKILRQRVVGLGPELKESVGDFAQLIRIENEYQDIAEALWQAADCFDIGCLNYFPPHYCMLHTYKWR